MTQLNLFPYRELVRQRKLAALHKGIVLSALSSLLAALIFGAAMQSHDSWWSKNPVDLPNTTELLQLQEQLLQLERERLWANALEPIRLERQQRQQLLNLLNSLVVEPVDGVFIGHLSWSAQFLEADLWVASADLVAHWVAWVKTVPGFDSVHMQDVTPLAVPNPAGLFTFRVRIGLAAATSTAQED